MHHRLVGRRLVGNEPGLLAYWPLVEGTGTVVHDQTANSHDGKLSDGPKWVASGAPIGEHPGICRSSFGFDGRSIESGLSALLYHQQEMGATGYGGETKPLKKDARVMLAVATKSANSDKKRDCGLGCRCLARGETGADAGRRRAGADPRWWLREDGFGRNQRPAAGHFTVVA
ncbi:MAG: hypothetical protein M3347_07760 [Armatimonadota bacterium]|nr:hypothetical protein [Armatimonadota bacterium]